MSVIDSILNKNKTAFSFEVLPPLKGMGTEKLFSGIKELIEFDPKYINITTHRSETVYRQVDLDVYERLNLLRRPGTVAIASAIKNKFHIPVVPHIVCSGYTKEETEYALLDLQILEIFDVLVLRGDKAKDDSKFKPEKGGSAYALELAEQISNFNNGYFCDGTPICSEVTPFHFGVAGYPEKHIESPNLDQDLFYLKKKVDAGAEYVVTQLFYDNQKFFDFAERARNAGITVPIIPGIKPFSKKEQLMTLPCTFNIDLPNDLVQSVSKCKSDAEVREVGKEWCIAQCKELQIVNVPSIHFYTIGAVDIVKEIAKAIY